MGRRREGQVERDKDTEEEKQTGRKTEKVRYETDRQVERHKERQVWNETGTEMGRDRRVERQAERQESQSLSFVFGSCDAVLLHVAVTLTTGCADGIMVAGGCGVETGGVAWTGVGVVEITGV